MGPDDGSAMWPASQSNRGLNPASHGEKFSPSGKAKFFRSELNNDATVAPRRIIHRAVGLFEPDHMNAEATAAYHPRHTPSASAHRRSTGAAQGLRGRKFRRLPSGTDRSQSQIGSLRRDDRERRVRRAPRRAGTGRRAAAVGVHGRGGQMRVMDEPAGDTKQAMGTDRFAVGTRHTPVTLRKSASPDVFGPRNDGSRDAESKIRPSRMPGKFTGKPRTFRSRGSRTVRRRSPNRLSTQQLYRAAKRAGNQACSRYDLS